MMVGKAGGGKLDLLLETALLRSSSSPMRLMSVRELLPRFSLRAAGLALFVVEASAASDMAPSDDPARARPSLGGAGGAPKPRTGRELVRRSLVAKRFSVENGEA